MPRFQKASHAGYHENAGENVYFLLRRGGSMRSGRTCISSQLAEGAGSKVSFRKRELGVSTQLEYRYVFCFVKLCDGKESSKNKNRKHGKDNFFKSDTTG